MKDTIARLTRRCHNLERRYGDFLRTRWMTHEEEAEYNAQLARLDAESKHDGDDQAPSRAETQVE